MITSELKEFISPVCLPWGAESNKDITTQKATLTGWGDTEFGITYIKYF